MAEKKEKQHVSDNAQLMAEWDFERNLDVSPEQLTVGSNKRIWWICHKGHSYPAYIHHRVKGSGCPYCAGKKAIKGETDLLSQYPDIAIEWHPTKNGTLMPDTVTTGSSKKVWWLGKCGHEWETAISHRTLSGTNCPICSNQEILPGYNDLFTTHPQLAKEWHPTKNGEVSPHNIGAGTHKKVWWLGECGHEWEASIAQRRNGTGCPYCAHIKLLSGFNDFATLFPACLKDWDYDKNQKTPSSYLGAGREKVWWKCHNCGYEWMASLENRSKGHGCSQCVKLIVSEKSRERALTKNGSLANKHPDLMKYWHIKKNNNLSPYEVVAESGKKVWWIGECGHEWQRPINYFVKNHTCPICSGKKLLQGFNDLNTLFPQIAQEWDYDKNQKVPCEYLSGSSARVWWKCSVCGNKWIASIHSRTSTNSKCKICASKAGGIKNRQNALVETGSVEDHYPGLLTEWDYTKNTLTPSEVTPYADTKIWWICNTCGRSWKTSVRNRTKLNSKCPSCVSSGTSFPEQVIFFYARQVYPDAINRFREYRSDGITELDIWIPSIKTAIEYDGYYSHINKQENDLAKENACREMGIRLIRIKEKPELESIIFSKDCIQYAYVSFNHKKGMQQMLHSLFASYLGTVVKSDFIDVDRDFDLIMEQYKRQELDNSLLKLFPQIASEWHPTKNGNLQPCNFSARNGKKVWWKCSTCGHEWTTTIASRTAGTGCSVCALKKIGMNNVRSRIAKNGSLYEYDPELCKEWHPVKNLPHTPHDYTYRSGQKVWWKCSSCGHEWQSVIASRTNGCGCPQCAKLKKRCKVNPLPKNEPPSGEK